MALSIERASKEDGAMLPVSPLRSIKIEKGIPIPPKVAGKGAHKWKTEQLPWKDLAIGDSFVFESKSSGYLRKSAEKAGIQIEIRGLDIEVTAYGGRVAKRFRVWRIA